MNRVLVDTGPLVAVLADRDQHHYRCVEILKTLQTPLFTCWPVITEATYLLRRAPEAVQSVFQMLEHGLLRLLPLDETAAPWFTQFFTRYRDHNPQLADAALIYLSEREGISTVFTLDHRDFRVYSASAATPLTLLPDEVG